MHRDGKWLPPHGTETCGKPASPSEVGQGATSVSADFFLILNSLVALQGKETANENGVLGSCPVHAGYQEGFPGSRGGHL